jgi:hypothetical protein
MVGNRASRGARLLSALLLLAPGAAFAQAGAPGSEATLPDTRAFLEEVRRNLASDETLLENYTFTEDYTERRLDSGGGVKKVEQKLYEVYPSVEPGKVYRRLVAQDGRKLTEQELAAQDKKHEEKSEKRLARHAGEDEEARKARLEGDTEKEREVVDEVFRMDDIRVAGRETVDGRPAIVVTFTPRPGYKPVTKGAKVIQKLDGRAWIDEEDKQLVRLEGRLLENVGVGPAKLARLQKGATAYFQRRKVNNEIWLPAEARFSGAAKMFLFFGGRLELQSRYSDYKKFSVGTEESVAETPGN